jgi:hypothetical protein
MSMVARRSIHLADGGLERLRRRIIDVIDVGCNALAGCSRVATATTTTADHRHDIVLFRDNLRHGDDDHDRRRG